MNESSSPADDRLNDLLRNWSHEQAVTESTVDRLQRTIMAHPASSREPARNPRAILAVCAVAASLLVAVFAGLSVPGRVAPKLTGLPSTNESRAKLATLWNETGRLFGSDLQWLCDLDGELQLGVGPADAVPTPGQQVCLTLTLRVYDSTQGTWKNVWTNRVACRGGEVLDFASADKRSTGSLWVQSRPDGQFAVSHWLNWKDHPHLSGSIETTVPADSSEIVSESIEDGQRIQLVQQVWRPSVG